MKHAFRFAQDIFPAFGALLFYGYLAIVAAAWSLFFGIAVFDLIVDLLGLPPSYCFGGVCGFEEHQ